MKVNRVVLCIGSNLEKLKLDLGVMVSVFQPFDVFGI